MRQRDAGCLGVDPGNYTSGEGLDPGRRCCQKYETPRADMVRFGGMDH